ncbi:MAG: flagellar hook protein FlgE [Clostridia bacterium]|nr:flagellar hook protein FlgE [Clostridia bacterium]
MLRSLFAAVSGMQNMQTKIDVIGNNIANVNTTGFKYARVKFQDMLSQTLRGASAPQQGRGGINPSQVGLGMVLGSIDNIHTQGSLQPTGRPEDLAIQGNGFFVVSDGSRVFYTRDGSFSRGSDGDLVNAATGMKVLGWTAASDGTIDPTGPVGPINIPLGEKTIAKATENIVFMYNLDANAAVNDTHSVSVDVYDSLGVRHTLTFTFKKGTNPNEWTWDVTGGTDAGTIDKPTDTTLKFNMDGSLESPTTPPEIKFTPTNPNAAEVSIKLNFRAVTQLAAPSTLDYKYQDGFPPGELEGFTIGSDGVISGTYSNGLVRNLGQIALAAFGNPEGLLKAGDNLYQITSNSGEPRIGTPGTQGRGTIQTATLEMSNVDLARELTEMIITSRAFQANSRVVTTSDEILQELINLKR